MSGMARVKPRLPAGLGAEIGALNPQQRRAILHSDNVVVRAGPGSGKTRTLVAKVAYLLAADVRPRQGVAAITYTNQAAREVTRRLARLGLHPGRRLVSRTVHSWCLAAILRPYAHLMGTPLPVAGAVLDDNAGLNLVRECLDDAGVDYRKESWEQPIITKIRRCIAAGEDIEGFDAAKVAAAELFEARLAERDVIDYEAMVIRSLDLIRRSAAVRDLLSARYPWVVVDEYQDLGPVLHRLVLVLHEQAGVKVCAVGDPDQSIMGFTGADPRYLNELAGRADFLDVPLNLNYRSGSAIIAASQAALGDARDHRANPERPDAGVVEAIAVTGGLEDHAEIVVEHIGRLIGAGIRADSIAVLYPARGPVLDAIQQGLANANIEYVHERDQRFPSGPLVDFLRSCAARRLAGPQTFGHGDAGGTAAAPTIGDLVGAYRQMRAAAELPDVPAIEVGRRLQPMLDVERGGPATHEDESLTNFLDRLDDGLDLGTVAAASREQRDQSAMGMLRGLPAQHGVTLAQFAGPELTKGKVIVTTYHSAKGREFAVVILPGLVEGIVPRLEWSANQRRYREPARAVIAEQRRTFYVALTRAADAAILVYGSGWATGWGAWNELGPSRFVTDVVERLELQ